MILPLFQKHSVLQQKPREASFDTVQVPILAACSLMIASRVDLRNPTDSPMATTTIMSMILWEHFQTSLTGTRMHRIFPFNLVHLLTLLFLVLALRLEIRYTSLDVWKVSWARKIAESILLPKQTNGRLGAHTWWSHSQEKRRLMNLGTKKR
jgi:hypothetical protein